MRNKERFVKRRQRLIGPKGSTLKVSSTEIWSELPFLVGLQIEQLYVYVDPPPSLLIKFNECSLKLFKCFDRISQYI